MTLKLLLPNLKNDNISLCFQALSIGDYYQLPPVGGSPPYKSANSPIGAAGRKFIVDNFTLFQELTTPNYRQNKDPVLNQLCTAARFCRDPGAELLDKLNARCSTVEQAAAATKPQALCTASTHAVVDKLNKDHLDQCRASDMPGINLWAR